MKKTLNILQYEEKYTTAGKKYGRFKTNEGWMSVFDGNISNQLKGYLGKSCDVDMTTNGNFSNIEKIYEEQSNEKPVVEVVKMSTTTQTPIKMEFPTSMKVSYAKDIFCAMCTRVSQASFDSMNEEQRLGLMDLSLKAVEKAINHFS